ncbi:guanine deaminase [Pseudohyphozyma bogoriensis]|nr:guanine deaminase [Pseudohyphozyma bogoriensis]
MAVAQIFTGTFLNPSTNHNLEILENWLVAVDENGCITLSEAATTDAAQKVLAEAKETGATVVEMDRMSFVLPGFVDTHIHAPQYMNAGTALDKPLMEWLAHYTFSSESRIDADPSGLGERVYGKLVERLVEGGTTAASVFGTLTVAANMVLAKAFQNAGIRGQIGKVAMDLNGIDTYIETTNESLSRSAAFIASMTTYMAQFPAHLQLVQPVLTPRFVPTCSKPLLLGIAELARTTGTRIQSHMCEAVDQVEWSKSMWDGKSDVEVLDSLGLLTPLSLMAHCTHSTPANLALLSKRGTSVAHCPLSNVYFSPEQAFPLREAWKANVSVGLGSDISGGYQVTLGESMRWAVGVSRIRAGAQSDEEKEKEGSRAITWREAIWLATRGGYESLGINAGSFEVGKSFDAQLIRLGGKESRVDIFDELPTEEFVEKWWCNGNEKDRVGVWVQGRRIRNVQW